MNKYNVRIISEALNIYAESEEEANEIAMDIMNGEPHTQLVHEFSVIDFETDLEEKNVEKEKTVIY